MENYNKNICKKLGKVWLEKDILQKVVCRKFLSEIEQLKKDKENEKKSRQDKEDELLCVKKELAIMKKSQQDKESELLCVKIELANEKENNLRMELEMCGKTKLIEKQKFLLKEFSLKNSVLLQAQNIAEKDEPENEIADDDTVQDNGHQSEKNKGKRKRESESRSSIRYFPITYDPEESSLNESD